MGVSKADRERDKEKKGEGERKRKRERTYGRMQKQTERMGITWTK